MRKNRLNRRIWSSTGQAQPKKRRSEMILAVILTLVLFFIPESFGNQADSQKLKQQNAREQKGVEMISTKSEDHQSPAEINSTKPERTQLIPDSMTLSPGKQIKWQVVCSGASCGSNTLAYRVGRQDGCKLCGTAGQVAVGRGSSPSYGMNSGFWQTEYPGEEFVCGDLNGDISVDFTDILYLIDYIFRAGEPPMCDPWTACGDVNDDSGVDFTDILYLIDYIFRGGSPPVGYPGACGS